MSLADLPSHDPRPLRQKWELPTRRETAQAVKAAKEANWREVCRAVNIRDGHACRACRKPISLSAITLLERGHHHHIQYRSQGGQDTTEGVCLLDATCHEQIHVKKTLRIEGNANEGLTFWKRDIESGAWFIWRRETAPGVYERD